MEDSPTEARAVDMIYEMYMTEDDRAVMRALVKAAEQRRADYKLAAMEAGYEPPELNTTTTTG